MQRDCFGKMVISDKAMLTGKCDIVLRLIRPSQIAGGITTKHGGVAHSKCEQMHMWGMYITVAHNIFIPGNS